MAEMTARVAFSDVSAPRQVGPSSFEADVHPDWTIVGKPNGGYLLAILGRAAALVGEHPHVIAASAHYLRSPDPGPVTCEVEVLRAGRSSSQLRARLAQEGEPCVETLLTTSTLRPKSTVYWDSGLPTPGTASIEDCMRLPSQSPDGMNVAILEHVGVHLEPDSLMGFVGQPSGRGELHGWLSLPEGEDFDPAALLFAVDALPPATFDVERSGWVPTLELTAYVRALPAPGPVRVLQRAQMITGQRVDQACFVWDSTGRLVAQATQLAGIRLG